MSTDRNLMRNGCHALYNNENISSEPYHAHREFPTLFESFTSLILNYLFFLFSSTKLYYLDKHGYRIALQSEASEYDDTKTFTPIPRPTTTDALPPLNGYDVMHGENEAERDETIDYNFSLLEATNKDDNVLRYVITNGSQLWGQG